MPTEQFVTLINLLKAHDLAHLFGTLHEQTSLPELQALLSSHRPLLLEHLRKLGVEKLGDRQALANALNRAEKAGQLPAARPIPHLQPPIFDEDDESVTVKLKVPADVQSNQLKVHIDANSLRSHAAATQLMWGDASDAERVGASGPFDLIIGSDLLYAPQSFPLLLETLAELSVPGATEVLFTFPTRYTESIFIEQAAEADFETIEDVTEVDVNVWSLRLRLRDD